MKRWISFLVPCLVAWLPSAAPAAGMSVDGIPVTLMPPSAAPQSRTAPVTVVYHFSHYCGTCADIAVPVDKWLASLPADVAKLKVVTPASGQGGQEPTNVSYQAMQQLGVLPRVESQLFALVARGNGSLPDEASLLAWLGKAGVSQEAFRKAADSFGVANQAARAQAAVRRLMQSDAAGVPVVVVDDRYIVSVAIPREIDRMLAAAATLVARAQQERRSRGTGCAIGAGRCAPGQHLADACKQLENCTMRARFIVPVFLACAPAGTSFASEAVCEQSESIVNHSPDGLLAASVQHQVCATAAGGVAAAVTVFIGDAAAPLQGSRVVSVGVPRSRDEWPKAVWRGNATLEVWVPNLAKVLDTSPAYKNVSVKLKYCGDDPDLRARVAQNQVDVQQWMTAVTRWNELRKTDAQGAGPRPERPVAPNATPRACDDSDIPSGN